MELQNPLKESNIFIYGKDINIINDTPPLDASFGISKSDEQNAISVLLDGRHFNIWKWIESSAIWEPIGEVNNKENIILGWIDGITKYYFQAINPGFGTQISVIGIAGDVLVDSDPSDGITDGELGILKNNNQINASINPINSIGIKGEKGDSGIISSGQFKWSNWMGQAPGFQAGNMEYGGVAAYGEATQLTFHKEDANGVDQSTFLDQYLNAKSGQIKTILDANPSHNNVYQIVGASIDSNGNYVFDVYNVSYDDIAVTTGSTEVYFVLVGSEGPQGPSGPKGEKGDTGEDGRGINGASMSQNFELQLSFTDGGSKVFPPMGGADGAKGDKGDQGAMGIPGLQGQAGQDGIGLDGAKGDKGEAGLDGSAANQGQKGDKGESLDMGGTMTSHIIPDSNASYDLGNAEYKIRHLFLSDNSMYIGDSWLRADGGKIKMPSLIVSGINLNNDGQVNEVDGSSGHWSIQEGSDDLFLINRLSGKKYKFNLTEM
jgi:hypothetical protein